MDSVIHGLGPLPPICILLPLEGPLSSGAEKKITIGFMENPEVMLKIKASVLFFF